MKTVILFIFLTAIMTSCREREKIRHFSKFDREIYLKFNNANIKEIYKGGFVHILDSLIILTNSYDDGKQIHIYNQKFELIKSSGIKGSGPGELVNPFGVTIDSKNKIIWFADMGRKRILKYPLDSIFLNEDYRPKEFVNIPDEVYVLLLYRVYNDSIFSFVNPGQNKDIISYFDLRGNIIEQLSLIDYLNLYKSENIENNTISTHNYCSHPNHKLHAITYMYSDVLSIIDSNGKLLSITRGPDNINQQPQSYNAYTTRFTYRGMECDSNFIYCSYLGGVLAEKGKEIANSPFRLFVFDWKGNPIAALKFDKSFSTYVIDRDRNRLIAWSQDSCDLMYCNLPEMKK